MNKWLPLFIIPVLLLVVRSLPARPVKASTQVVCTWGRVVGAQDPDMLLIRVLQDTTFLLKDLRQEQFPAKPTTLLCRLDQKF